MSFLTRESLLKKAERRYEEFELSINGETSTCRIRSLTERERSDYESAMQTAIGKKRDARMRDAKRRLIVLCVVDENNEPMLKYEDIHELESIDSRVTSTIFDRCVDLVGFGSDDIEDLSGN